MKASISSKGILTIEVETGVEAYALKQWLEANLREGAVITVGAMLFLHEPADEVEKCAPSS